MSNRSYIIDNTYMTWDGNSNIQVGEFESKTQSGGNSINTGFTDNAYSMTFIHTVNPVVSWDASDHVGPPRFIGSLQTNFGAFNVDAPSGRTANDDIKLANKLLSKIRGHEFNLGVALAEAPDTFALVTQTAINLSRAMKSLRRGKFASAARHLGVDLKPGHGLNKSNTIASNWLQLQYGWLPLLEDVEQAAKATAAILNKPFQATYRVSSQVANVVEYPTNLLSPHFQSVTTDSLRRKVTISEDPSAIQSLSLTDLASVVWEKVPYSFVADWFVPIGSYLAARSGIPSLPITSVVDSHLVITSNSFLNSGSGYVIIGGQSMDKLTVKFDRTVGTSYPNLPLPTLKPLENSFSVPHMKNGIALLVATFNRR